MELQWPPVVHEARATSHRCDLALWNELAASNHNLLASRKVRECARNITLSGIPLALSAAGALASAICTSDGGSYVSIREVTVMQFRRATRNSDNHGEIRGGALVRTYCETTA